MRLSSVSNKQELGGLLVGIVRRELTFFFSETLAVEMWHGGTSSRSVMRAKLVVL